MACGAERGKGSFADQAEHRKTLSFASRAAPVAPDHLNAILDNSRCMPSPSILLPTLLLDVDGQYTASHA
jgi:hypothetical protein